MFSNFVFMTTFDIIQESSVRPEDPFATNSIFHNSLVVELQAPKVIKDFALLLLYYSITNLLYDSCACT